MKIKHLTIALVLGCALALFFSGCATTQAAPAPKAPAVASAPAPKAATDKTLRSIQLGNWLKLVGDLDGKAKLETDVWKPGVTAIACSFEPVIERQANGTFIVRFRRPGPGANLSPAQAPDTPSGSMGGSAPTPAVEAPVEPGAQG